MERINTYKKLKKYLKELPSFKTGDTIVVQVSFEKAMRASPGF